MADKHTSKTNYPSLKEKGKRVTRKQDGFTLIELLVVIAIIALLMVLKKYEGCGITFWHLTNARK